MSYLLMPINYYHNTYYMQQVQGTALTLQRYFLIWYTLISQQLNHWCLFTFNQPTMWASSFILYSSFSPESLISFHKRPWNISHSQRLSGIHVIWYTFIFWYFLHWYLLIFNQETTVSSALCTYHFCPEISVICPKGLAVYMIHNSCDTFI